MQLEIGPHLDTSEIEQYSMGTLPEPKIKLFEEHFLACESCQDQLLEMEAYVNAVRSVSPKLRTASASRREWRFTWGTPAWVAAGIVMGGALFLAKNWMPHPTARPEVAVVLRASRGIEDLDKATASAGQPLMLIIDLMEIPQASSYRLEIVDSPGKPEWNGAAVSQGGKILQQIAKGLSAGRHYVRLYGANGELLREFRLLVGKV